jgi:urease accessory protein
MTQLRAIKCLAAGSWRDDPACTITLNKDQRHRRRIVLNSDTGLEFLLDLPEAIQLRHGDGLQLKDGRVIKVLAEAEELLEVRGSNTHHLLRLAWHLGNRHLEAQIEEGRILVRRDHVIEDMLKGLGATTALVVEPFSPQGGAYDDHGHGGHHHHDHAGHNHDH